MAEAQTKLLPESTLTFNLFLSVNLALGKPTAQSSTYSNNAIGTAVSGRAVDGNDDTDMLNKHCSQTQEKNPSWWQVDLGSDYVPVSDIHIVNRFTGAPQKDNKNYTITLGEYMFLSDN